ncbi:hypothetical protein [Streptomyces sp. NRRL S-1448]|uniref:hypothetical protein n=1 Tax=Streptomyces sp. NRRL S-1448 TaxID=1463883 RepID=UPI00131CD271|nr:hypothetical protein [Streptomyces sp. NRRL S-1448]
MPSSEGCGTARTRVPAGVGVVDRPVVLGTPPGSQRWQHAQVLAAGDVGLLRPYEGVRAAG